MSALPFRNARLRKVVGSGGRPGFGKQGGGGPEKWSGNLPVAVGERLFSSIEGSKLTQVDRTEMALPMGVGIAFARGDLVTYTRRRAPEETRKVQGIEDIDRVRMVRLVFEEA